MRGAGSEYGACPMSAGRFARDTAVEQREPGRYGATIDEGWWVVRGPNGGYIAAIVLRAMEAHVADVTRTPRSLTLHYTRPPESGLVEVTVTTERTGRTLTS